jgi:hypothetical protein
MLFRKCLALRLFPTNAAIPAVDEFFMPISTVNAVVPTNPYFELSLLNFTHGSLFTNLRDTAHLTSNPDIAGVFSNFTSELYTRAGGSLELGAGAFASNDTFSVNSLLGGMRAGYSSIADLQAPVSILSTRLYLSQYYHILGCFDYLNDWRHLKLEREI